jgi:hypothetical protein
MISFHLREVLTTDRGKMLEIIGVVKFVIHIGIQFYLKKVGFWSDENFMGGIFSLSRFFKNRKLDRFQDAIISILPAFKSCISELTDEKKEVLLENPCSHNVNHNDLEWVLENLWKPNTIAIFNTQSESSDSGLRFQIDNDSNEQFFLLIAYKNYGPTTCLQKATISDEIEKASFFFNDSSKNRKLSLLVVATNVGYLHSYL